MATLLVIGGSGFFGKSILDSYKRGMLISWDIKSITIMSRNATKLREYNKNIIDESITLIDQDITTCVSLPFANYVIHAASSSNANDYLANPIEERDNIVFGTKNFCRLAKTHLKNSNILYVSSGAVYGRQPENIESIPETYPTCSEINELSENKRYYAWAKRESETEIVKLAEQGLKVSIARCFAFVGKYLPNELHFAIGNFIADGLSKKNIIVKAEMPVYRTYMYADDLVIWLMSILKNTNNDCNVYNVGSDEKISIAELADKIAKIFNVEAIHNRKKIDNIRDIYIPDISKAKKKLNVQLTVNIEEAIRKMKAFNEFKNNN